MKHSPPPNEVSRRSRNIVLAALAVYLMLLPLSARVAPLQDQMDWVLQAKILAHPSDPAFARDYQVLWRPVPNLLGTLLIAGASRLLPIFTAAAVVYAAYVALFIFAFVYFARSDGQSRPLVELLGPLYALNHFFLMGFFNFVLGLAGVFLALGWLRRHGAHGGWRTWFVFALLVLATYLSHFLAFGILCLASLALAVRLFGRELRRYAPWLTALVPSLAALGWYTFARNGEFYFQYAFHNPLYYLWYQVGPWAVASSYYPLTPNWAVWTNATLNAAAIVAIPLLVLGGLRRRQIDLSSPWLWAAAALLVIGLAAPTRLYELLRPGQRLIFVALLLLAASVHPHQANPRTYRAALLGLAALLCWNGLWWHDAARQTADDLRIVERSLTPDARLLLLADSHFHYHEARPYREKLADPYAYPNSVNPLRYLPYAYLIEHGGYLRTLFGTGIVEVRRPDLLPDVDRPWKLADPAAAGRYSHLVATGRAPALADIAQRAAPLFTPVYRGENLLVMTRRNP